MQQCEYISNTLCYIERNQTQIATYCLIPCITFWTRQNYWGDAQVSAVFALFKFAV